MIKLTKTTDESAHQTVTEFINPNSATGGGFDFFCGLREWFSEGFLHGRLPNVV
jgi:hypothetical protein